MSRKDYIAMAEMLARLVGNARALAFQANNEKLLYTEQDMDQAMLEGLRSAADNMADVFSRDNDRFDRARFMQACGF